MRERPPQLKKVAIDELVEDYRLYPRAEVDGPTVEEFREALRAGAKFPPLRVCAKTLRIIDGYHRKVAYEREQATHVLCSLEEVADDRDLFTRAAAANAAHGRRYTSGDLIQGVKLAKRLGLTREQVSAAFFLPPERVEKLERISSGGGSATLERNIPSSRSRSKLVEKSMDTISQLTWATSLLRCLREGHVNGKSEELRRHLEELSQELPEYLRRTAPPPEADTAPAHVLYTRLYPPDVRADKAA